MADLQPGARFAGCRIDGVIGRGGMGVIYHATQIGLGRPVAIKLISGDQADGEIRARFEREARLTASIEHPNVIPVYAAGEEQGDLYLVMRYVPGTDLHALLQSDGRLEPGRAAAIIGQLAQALDAAHSAGLVHRDVKPANVLISDDDHVYLSDFGITRVQDGQTRITDSGSWVGTVDFMSPEHLRGEPTDARSDVYALGCVLQMALTGAPPFRRTTLPATINAHLNDVPPPPSLTEGVPDTFDAVLARALAKDPRDRYTSAGDLGRAAAEAAAGAVREHRDRTVARGSARDAAEQPTQVIAPAAAAAPGSVPATLDPPPTSVTRLAPSDAAVTRIADRGDAPERRTVADDDALADRPPAAGDGARPDVASDRDDASPPPAAAASRPERRRRRTRRLTAVLALIVLAIPAAAYAIYLTRETPRTTGPITTGETEAAARAFAAAYTAEDPEALRGLLTVDAERVGVDSRQQGRRAVVAEYARQFAGMRVRRYTLSNLKVQSGEAGRAQADYEVTRIGAAPLRGQITMAVVRRAGKAQIALIVTQASA